MLDINIDGHIARLTIRNAEKHNALSPEIIAMLTVQFRQIAMQDNIYLVTLTSEGKSFCAGADLHAMQQTIDMGEDENLQDAEKLFAMFEAIWKCPQPVICCVQGNTMGGGVGLVSVCDIVVAKASAQFCFSEVKLGLIPSVISSFVLQKMSFQQAQAYMITAEKFSAHMALATGLITKVVDTDEALAEMISHLEKTILLNSPKAVRETKKLLRTQGTAPNPIEMKDLTTKTIAYQRVSPEGQEGLKAFFEKRTPSWVESEPVGNY